ncbi:MAG: RNA polymerase sigma factor [Clostridia bacterium]|nr:RNA polymerase sigma factor [Clostridia bacterium]
MKDKEIIALFNLRDQRAITETKNKYGDYMLSVSERILHNRYDAEECFNDALLSLWNCVPPEKPRDLKSFLCRLVRNTSVDRLRIETANKRSAEIVSITDELDECIAPSGSAEDDYIKGELRRCLDKFYKKLSKRDRDIFFCRYFYACSSSQIAEKFDLSEEYVRTVLSRTRKKLKEHLEAEGYR